MGVLEINSRIRRKNRNLRAFILATIQTAGVLSFGLLAPNVLGAMSKLGIIKKPRSKELIIRSRNVLIKSGFIKYTNGKLELTLKGESELRRLGIWHSQIVKQKKWDGLWRVLIFDIPEKRKMLREKVRNTLVSVGFRRLQDSVWIYPYDCEDFVALLKIDFKVGKDILYLIVDSLENDSSLRALFGLRQR